MNRVLIIISKSRTRITAGARYEYTRYDYVNNTGTNKTATGNYYYRPDNSEDSFSNFSPKLGLVQAITEDASAFVNLARGNRAPQTTDLYRLQQSQIGQEGADSEQIDSIEIGFRELGDGLQYEISTFAMKKKNYFFRDSGGDNVSDGKTRHYGVELGAFMPFAEQFDIAGNFTYAIHEYDFDNASNGIVNGTDMDTAPRHLANVRLGWNFMPKSRAELEWVHVGRYYTDEAAAHTYDGHDLLNLRATHHVSQNVTVYGRISNLLNTEYAERADYTSFGGDRYFVGEERGLHVGASYSF